MAESLRDQLLKSGLASQLKSAKPTPAAESKSQPRSGDRSRGKSQAVNAQKKPRDRDDMDLGKAYALRNQADTRERQRSQQEQEQRARAKKERRQKLATVLVGKSLNAEDADVARHFPHADKIRRVYVTAAQLSLVNRGELGVVQQAGRFLLVTREVALAVQEIDPEQLLLLVDPDQPDDDDVPADLIW
ncbi:MAG: DUF2058 family protein [Dokdonella sp.]